MTLRIYDTLSREKRDFEPLDAQNVRMYVCGPTVYDFAHIGNARPVVIFDVLYRLLRRYYGKDHVTYVRNITDIDDKIMKAAEDSGEPIEAITARTTRAYHADMAALGALPPDVEPRATDHVVEMKRLVRKLRKAGHAYIANGHVLFHVPSWKQYGKLSRYSRSEIITGARVEVAPFKKDPADFILWKPSTEDQPGWKSYWRRGRPGWHLECSAMAAKHLGTPFDIHGGGQDLIFPHHENEIAQSRCADPEHGFAKYWMHNGYLMAEGKKMSKSLGNFYTVRDLLTEGDWPGEQHKKGEAIRLLLLKTHYRQPLDFTKDGIAEAKGELDSLYGALRRAVDIEVAKPKDTNVPLQGFEEALCDDLNTPLALLHLFGRMRQLNLNLLKDSPGGKIAVKRSKWLLLEMGKLLGILQADPEVWFKGRVKSESVVENIRLGMTVREEVILGENHINMLIEKREAARAAKNFAEADRIRDELAAQGVVLEDLPNGKTDWKRAG